MECSKAAVISIGKMSKRLKHQLLEFDSNEKEFVLGRNREAQCMILDVNVSRRHASLKHLSGQGWSITDNKVKFVYSEKATRFCEIFTLVLSTEHIDKSKLETSQNFVVFSEYMKFK